MQKYHRNDHVKVSDNYSSGLKFENGISSPMPSEWAGKEAIIIGSYNDKFGKPDTGGDYTLFFKRQGEVSWFPEKALTLIQENASGLMEQWKQERNEEIKMKSDIDWIFEHSPEVLKSTHGASVQALASCFGLDNLWGSRGEGFVWHRNAMQTMAIAKPFLEKGDKKGWLELCEEIKANNSIHSDAAKDAPHR